MRLKTLPSNLTAALLAAAFPFLISACADRNGKADHQSDATEVATRTGIKYVDLEVGKGPEATPGKTVEVHYTGWLEDGTKFDSSLDRQEPFTFRLGAGEVIEGWDQGVAGMKVGGKRKLTIPPELGYGDEGSGGVIPPGATLIFEVKLLGVQ
ncbi:MAG TPA: FKBP-type peptidyl-prolyl cis-trans isomerase [Thermoanaerobaculia bacterium]|jgi:FKBP-type peptidyl-prolyl cis-trans isomerase|nr:FKBP-type peptidyl-prolyl cis-trans isomerase [Thermoanaerobaculia bacterium]